MRLQKRILVLGLTVAVGVVALILTGCGSDDKSTSSTNYGSLTDPEFVVVQSQVDMFVDSTVNFLRNGLNIVYGISDENGTILPAQYAPGPEDNDVFDTSYANGWHRVFIANQYEGYGTTVLDSIQYIKNGAYQESWANRDQLVYKHYWTWISEVDTIRGNAHYTFGGLNTAQATVTGTNRVEYRLQVVTGDSTVTRTFTIEATMSGFTLAKTMSIGWDHCPLTGSVSVTLTMTYQKDGADPVESTWTGNLAFDDGSLSAAFRLGNTVWQYQDQVCINPQ